MTFGMQTLRNCGSALLTTVAVIAKLMTLQAASDGSGYMQDWQITSTGTISWVKPIQVQVVERFKGQNYAVFAYAAFATANGCNAMKLSGPTPPTATTDSYDSSTGTTPAAA